MAPRTRRLAAAAATAVVAAATTVLAALPAAASSTVSLDGSFSVVIPPKDFVGHCPSGGGDECGTLQFTGLGTADWAYVFGPTFEPNGTKGCFNVDGTLTITLHSDGSRTSGPLTGVFCNPGNSAAQRGTPSYGHPFSEDDTIAFANGTGQFAGLQGLAAFHTQSAGARFIGTMTGTLSN